MIRYQGGLLLTPQEPRFWSLPNSLQGNVIVNWRFAFCTFSVQSVPAIRQARTINKTPNPKMKISPDKRQVGNEGQLLSLNGREGSQESSDMHKTSTKKSEECNTNVNLENSDERGTPTKENRPPILTVSNDLNWPNNKIDVVGDTASPPSAIKMTKVSNLPTNDGNKLQSADKTQDMIVGTSLDPFNKVRNTELESDSGVKTLVGSNAQDINDIGEDMPPTYFERDTINDDRNSNRDQNLAAFSNRNMMNNLAIPFMDEVSSTSLSFNIIR